MKKSFLFVGLLGMILYSQGCKENTMNISTGEYVEYGNGIEDISSLTPVHEILEKSSSFIDKTVTVKGIIASVCPASGCFLRLGQGSKQIYVDLKKSGFHLPPGKNVGRIAYVTGLVQLKGDEVIMLGRGVRIMKRKR